MKSNNIVKRLGRTAVAGATVAYFALSPYSARADDSKDYDNAATAVDFFGRGKLGVLSNGLRIRAEHENRIEAARARRGEVNVNNYDQNENNEANNITVEEYVKTHTPEEALDLLLKNDLGAIWACTGDVNGKDSKLSATEYIGLKGVFGVNEEFEIFANVNAEDMGDNGRGNVELGLYDSHGNLIKYINEKGELKPLISSYKSDKPSRGALLCLGGVRIGGAKELFPQKLFAMITVNGSTIAQKEITIK